MLLHFFTNPDSTTLQNSFALSPGAQDHNNIFAFFRRNGCIAYIAANTIAP